MELWHMPLYFTAAVVGSYLAHAQFRQSSSPTSTDDHANHLHDLDDGAGCVEIWEKTSEDDK